LSSWLLTYGFVAYIDRGEKRVRAAHTNFVIDCHMASHARVVVKVSVVFPVMLGKL
jgi:hypothetical protein